MLSHSNRRKLDNTGDKPKNLPHNPPTCLAQQIGIPRDTMTITTKLLDFSDKVWFYLNGHVNSQNNKCCSTENPHLIHKIPLNNVKIGVSCVLSERITDPVLCRNNSF
jgi:hypothetical protein